jgi:hypothetical protein
VRSLDLPYDRPLLEFEAATAAEAPDPPAVDLSRCVAIVPVASYVNLSTDTCLRGLEALGVRVERMPGSSQIDVARNISASRELIQGAADGLLFIDSDVTFDPCDALKLFRRPEPVVAGIYARKALGIHGQLIADFGPGQSRVTYGPAADRLYPTVHVGAGFMRIKLDFLKRMIRELKLPFANTGRAWVWPFFLPMVVQVDGEFRYKGEDVAFCYRCEMMGEPVLCDTSFRVGHIGDYVFSIEEAAGQELRRPLNIEAGFTTSWPPMPDLPPELAELVTFNASVA